MSVFTHEAEAIRAFRVGRLALIAAGLVPGEVAHAWLVERSALLATRERVFRFAIGFLLPFAPIAISYDTKHGHLTPEDRRYTGFEHTSYLRLGRGGSLALEGYTEDTLCHVPLADLTHALTFMSWWNVGAKLERELVDHDARDAARSIAEFNKATEEL